MRIGNFNWIVPFEIKIQFYYPIQTELELYELDFPIKSWTGWQSAPRYLFLEESASKAVKIAKIISSSNSLEVMLYSDSYRRRRHHDVSGLRRYFVYVGTGGLAECFASRPVLPGNDDYIRLGVGKWRTWRYVRACFKGSSVWNLFFW